MNNLHRQLAPISEAAWGEIDQEARRTFIRWIAGRRVVDVVGPDGEELAAVRTGHQVCVDTPFEGVQAHQRQVRQIVELRVPFRVSREAVDAVDRGAQSATGWRAQAARDWFPQAPTLPYRSHSRRIFLTPLPLPSRSSASPELKAPTPSCSPPSCGPPLRRPLMTVTPFASTSIVSWKVRSCGLPPSRALYC